jgi:hypothetical protein
MISKYFSWEEVIRSAKAESLGIDNSIPEELKPKALYTAQNMDIVREHLGKPILVSSWYRCLQLNRALGSKDTSDHLSAKAVDFTCPEFGTPLEVCKAIIRSGIKFKQLILEHTWVHISFSSNPELQNKSQVLSLLKDGTYAFGLTDPKGNKYE